MLRRTLVRLADGQNLPAPRTGRTTLSPKDAVRVHQARQPDQLPNTVILKKARHSEEEEKAVPDVREYVFEHGFQGSSAYQYYFYAGMSAFGLYACGILLQLSLHEAWSRPSPSVADGSRPR